MLSNHEKHQRSPILTKSQPALPGDEIVISGISGKFPNAENVQILSDKLYSKIDMVDDDEVRWKHFNNDIPRRMGKISGLEQFDATFFGVHYKQAQTMDPQGRLLIETAFEAVIDAGVNPKLMRETRTGCYVGACFSEAEKTWFYEKISTGGFGITGCSRAMLANRISYCLGINGPSFLLDTACSSSMYAFDCAFAAIKNGECDAALVGGSNLIIHPYVTLQFAKLGVLAKDGYCRPFDVNASGYTRSEAICVILLQKAKDAKRIYATVEYSKTNCDGYKVEGITYPSNHMQEKLLNEFYTDIKVDPSTVNYVEAHSTGTSVGDPEESIAIDNIFCKNRKTPLLVGSVKSNLGHSESSSGLCSIAKVLLAFENGKVAPNLHFDQPKPTIKALMAGRLQVCTEITDLQGDLIAINGFGFGGANAHILLRQNAKPKDNFGMPDDNIPRIINWSSRTEKGVSDFFDAIDSQHLDAEFVSLIHNTQSNDIAGYLYRGYGLYENNPTGRAKCLNKEIRHFSGLKRPIVWVFTGMGSQWAEMGTSLLELPLFRATVDQLQVPMEKYGIDLVKIITSDDPTTYDNIINSFVGITCIQAALVDVLKSIHLPYDFLIGHSLGELGCAYADGTITAEQMILAAYFRGIVSVETKIVRGAMAAIGLGYKQIMSEVPSTIDVACHNGIDSCTISGPEEDVRAFVETLKKDGVFAKKVASSDIAYHSRYIKDLGPKLLKMLRKHIPNPKRRSEKWLSTSIPINRWDQEEGKYSSAEYHTNNLLNPVLFEESMALLPANALTIEIAPHGLLQSILKRSMPNAIHLPLTQRGNKNNLQFLLSALGQMYISGIDMPLEKLYPEIKFPVSRGTRMLSPLVRWEHSEKWFVPRFELQRTSTSWERKVKVSLKDQDYDTIDGHIIDGRCLIPATAYIQLVWETMAIIKGPVFFDVNVEFEDVRFLRATSMAKGEEVELVITILRGTGQFSVTDGYTAVVTGVVNEIEKPLPLTTLPSTSTESEYPMLQTEDFYKELRLRGYHYEGAFKGVKEVRSDGLYARVKWDSNWISFLDCLLQVQILLKDSRSLMLPTRIQKLRINARDHVNMASKLTSENPYIDVFLCKTLGILVSGGVEMAGMHTSTVNRRKFPGNLVLESYKFIPHLPSPILRKSDAVRACVQLAVENSPVLKVKAVEVDTLGQMPIIDEFQNALDCLPLITADLMFLTPQEIDLGKIHVENGYLKTQTNCYFVILRDGLTDLPNVEASLSSVGDNGYLVLRETQNVDLILDTLIPAGLQLLAVFRCDEEVLVLYRKIKKRILEIPNVIFIKSKNYAWMDELRASIKEAPVILVAQNETLSGIMGLVNCIRKESLENSLSCVFIDDDQAPPFNINDPLYRDQLNLGLAMNIYRNGSWGSYRHLELMHALDEKPHDSHCFANISQKGDLSSLSWFQGSIDVTNNDNLIKIQYAALNFRDVMLATGRLVLGDHNRIDQECVLGLEFAGVNGNGERIIGLVLSGSLATHIVPQKYLVWNVPDNWSLKEAVTCPVVYMTVYAAFFTYKTIKKGDSILIHAGSGGVGLAAITVAFAYGLEVYTTVSNETKKKFLLDTFPQLKESNIGNSRDCSFEQMIKIQTNGKGVDFVLNSLADEKLHASIRCLGIGGTFLEIGKFDLSNNTKIGLGDFLKELSFRSILLDNLFSTSSDSLVYISQLFENDLRAGVIQPLHATVFEVNEVEKAFRYLGAGKHVGKVVLKVRDDVASPYSNPMRVLPRQYFNPNLVYVILGGLGGFGLELADWMVVRGARKLVMSSSRGITNSYQTYRIKVWEGYGTEVVINTSDISTISGCEDLLMVALTIGPVGGIFNLAVVLRDNILENQNEQKFIECLAPKADATHHLDQLSRILCPQLKHFVVFSSVSCGRGNAGQSNYGMANSIMERIVEQRVASGLPGKAIQWGAIGEVGILANISGNRLDMEIGGTVQQRISSCLANLDQLLSSSDAVVGSMVVAEKRLGLGGKLNVIESVLNIMGIRDIKQISMTASLSEVGMDSLMAVELKQTLEREFEIFLTPEDLRSLTFARLQELSDARGKDSTENVKLKLAGENKILGLNMILRTLGDERNSKEKYLRLQTKNTAEKINSCMLIIPGIEGVAGAVWHNVAINFNLPAFILQLTNTIDLTTISDMANAVSNDVKKIFSKKEFFYLVGYSFGAFITLELARILEESGMTGSVVLIDGAPVFLKQISYSHTTQISAEVTDESIQLMLIVAIIQNIFPLENPDEILLKLRECPTWQMKVDKLIQFGKSQTEFSEEYMRTIAQAMYNRLKILFELDITKVQKIKSPITLIRPTEVAFVDIEEDYELSRYTEASVTLKFIEGNHTSMLDNTKLADIINDCDPYLQSNKNFENYVWNSKAGKFEF